MEPTRFEFSTDWVTPHREAWERLILPSFKDAPCRMVEVGSYEGRSAIWWLEHLLVHTSSTLTCIDPWIHAGTEQRFDRNLALSGKSTKMEKRKGPSHVMLKQLYGWYDVAYIDGDHKATAVLSDAVMIWTRLKSGALVIFDDYGMKKKRLVDQPRRGVDVFLELWADDIDVLHSGYQVVIRKK